jgi:predicted DNA-binding transcriptional regulator YafY
MPTPDDSPLLARRLTAILVALNEGRELDPGALATEFGVSRRTIQRDLCQRFQCLNLERTDTGHYRLPQPHLGTFSFQDMEHFAALSGVRQLYPHLSRDFVRTLLDRPIDSALTVQGPSAEGLDSAQSRTFRQIEDAIRLQRCIGFSYSKPEGDKHYAHIAPYRLINHGGIWYMAALDGDCIKAFTFTKIDRLLVSDEAFERVARIEQLLKDEDSIWLNTHKTEVVLKVSAQVAGYFRRSRLIGAQKIEKELEDGGLIISGRIAHSNQILPTVRYWIPNIWIISPEHLQTEVEQQMRDYLEKH